MTEKQAWEIMNDPNNFTDELEDYSILNVARKTAMDALREVEQYRALGTVKELKIYKDIFNKIFREDKDMRIKVEPRKPTDRGGYYCMPLKKNVPQGHDDWKPAVCPECGRECWRLPLADVAEASGAKPLCTECALKKGVNNG